MCKYQQGNYQYEKHYLKYDNFYDYKTAVKKIIYDIFINNVNHNLGQQFLNFKKCAHLINEQKVSAQQKYYLYNKISYA